MRQGTSPVTFPNQLNMFLLGREVGAILVRAALTPSTPHKCRDKQDPDASEPKERRFALITRTFSRACVPKRVIITQRNVLHKIKKKNRSFPRAFFPSTGCLHLSPDSQYSVRQTHAYIIEQVPNPRSWGGGGAYMLCMQLWRRQKGNLHKVLNYTPWLQKSETSQS